MTRTLIGVVLALLFLYGIFQAWPLMTGPRISIESPEEYSFFPGGVVSVVGTVRNTATLTVNGGISLHDQKGHFSSTLTFPKGGSILTFVATDRFGRTVTATRTIFVP